MRVPVQRGELLDDFWRDGLLLDITYLRALVVDGISPADANTRLARLKAEKTGCATVAESKVAHITGSPSTITGLS